MSELNPDQFNGIVLYHGSDADIPIGDVVEARGSWVAGKYRTEPEHRKAFATVSMREAGGWGKNIYQVEYQDGETPREVPDVEGARRFTSQKGFRIIAKINRKRYGL